MTSQRGLYLYAVVGGDAVPGEMPGVGGAPVETVQQGALTAVVSEVGLQQLAAAVEGSAPELLAELAQRHHAVVLAAMDAADRVLPLRLGTVLTGRDAAREFLDRRAGELSAGLRDVRACREWGLTIEASDTGGHVPDARPASNSDVRTGTAYLLRRREQLAEDQRRQTARAGAVAAVADTVRAVAVRAAAGRRSGGDVLLDESYLVRRAAERRFLAVVDDCGDLLGDQGLRLRVTGPWPPYSFVPASLRAAA